MSKMLLREKCKGMIAELESALKNVVYARNISFSVIRLLFLKYVTDNCLHAYNGEQMKDYNRVQKMFGARDVQNGYSAVMPILKMLDEAYRLNGVITSSLNEYAKDLFGTDDSWSKKNSSMEQYRTVMGILAEMNLEEENESNELGVELAKCLLSMIDLRARDFASKSEIVTPLCISMLVNKLLDIKDGDVFVDFVAGAGLSTMAIVDDKKVKIINSEIMPEYAAVATMLYIMAGYEDFSMNVENSLVKYDENNCIADKIFVDAPMGVKHEIYGKNFSATWLAVEKTINMLKDGGRAVVVVPGSFLFGMTKEQINQRKKILENGWLKAVIALPACFYGTGVGVNLLVIEKTMVEKVVFINATQNGEETFSKKERKNIVLTHNGIDKISGIYKNKDVFTGVSILCGVNEIIGMNYDLTPVKYIPEEEIVDDYMTLDEINKELMELYQKIHADDIPDISTMVMLDVLKDA